MSRSRRWRRLWAPAAAYAAVCAALWPVPVFGLLHAESSAVVAGVGFFVAGLDGLRQLGRGVPAGRVAAGHVGLLLVPLALLTLSLAWRPNCGYAQGFFLFWLLVPPSVLLGVALAAALGASGVRRPGVWLVAVGLAWAVGGVLTDLRLHPQLFTTSHVFGGVLGPIYDEELAVRPGLVAAKGQTLLWAAVLLVWARWRRAPPAEGEGRRATVAGAALVVLLGLSYAFAVPLGIQQSAANIQRALSLRVDAGPVVLHLDPATPPAEADRLADEALYRYAQIRAALDVAPAEPVDVYLYPNADVKAALIGSRRTSVTPVWLPSPQVHMLADEVPGSLAHELVHVFAREFGVPVLGASPAVGLVEGLAVALEPPDGIPDAAALVVAGRALGGDAGGLDADPAAVVAEVMGPGGFWTARAGVAYTASGAFVAWLLERYGPGPVREAYRTGRFEPAFGAPLDALAAAWGRSLADEPVDPEAVAVAAWLFRRPSLFEVPCPHHVPAPVRLAREGQAALDDGRPAEALRLFNAALALDPYAAAALGGRLAAQARLGRGVEGADVAHARALADSLGSADALRLWADALRLSGERRQSGAVYRAAADSLGPTDAVGRLLLRRRARLGPGALRAVVAAPDAVPAGLERAAPVYAALLWARAERPAEAWRVARTWRPDRLTAGLDGAAEGRRVLLLLQAQLATRAGAAEEAGRLAEEAARAFRLSGPQSLAPLAADLAARARWRARREGRPPAGAGSILAVP